MHLNAIGSRGLRAVVTLATALQFASAVCAQPSDGDSVFAGSIATQGRPTVSGEYRIGPGDVLRVDVWKEPDASNPAAIVRSDGKISVPIIGDVQASGLTPAELGNILANKYQEFIRAVRVSVIPKEINSLRVYVTGHVKKEGPVRLQAPITVLQALAEAGGMTEFAKRKRIYILRGDGKRQTRMPFNYEAVVQGRQAEQNIILSPGDTIVVP